MEVRLRKLKKFSFEKPGRIFKSSPLVTKLCTLTLLDAFGANAVKTIACREEMYMKKCRKSVQKSPRPCFSISINLVLRAALKSKIAEMLL